MQISGAALTADDRLYVTISNPIGGLPAHLSGVGFTLSYAGSTTYTFLSPEVTVDNAYTTPPGFPLPSFAFYLMLPPGTGLQRGGSPSISYTPGYGGISNAAGDTLLPLSGYPVDDSALPTVTPAGDLLVYATDIQATAGGYVYSMALAFKRPNHTLYLVQPSPSPVSLTLVAQQFPCSVTIRQSAPNGDLSTFADVAVTSASTGRVTSTPVVPPYGTATYSATLTGQYVTIQSDNLMRLSASTSSMIYRAVPQGVEHYWYYWGW